MANYPTRGTTPWDTALKAYMDERETSQLSALGPGGSAGNVGVAQIDNRLTTALGIPLTADALYDARFPALPSEDAITVTVISDAEYQATPSLGVSGGTLVAPARLGSAPSDDLDFLGDTHFRYSGGPSGKGIDANFVGPANDIAGASQLLHAESNVSRGLTRLMWKVKPTTTTLSYRLTIGEVWEAHALRTATVTANQVYWIVVDFTTPKSRRVKLSLSAGNQFGGAIPTVGETLTRSTDRPLMVVVADSFGGGAGTQPDGASRLETFINLVAHALGMDLINLSIGGTGWTTASNSFPARVAAALQLNPAVVLVIGSRNDNTDDAATYAAARAALPALNDVPFVAIGGPSQSSFALVNTAVKNAATESGQVFLDLLGVITAPLTSSDNVHPTLAGHVALAKAVLARLNLGALRAAVASVSKALPTISLAASPTNAQAAGAVVNLTATVSGGYSGAAEFRTAEKYLGRGRVNAGLATLAVSGLALGTYALTARFVPDNQLRVRNVTSAPVPYSITPLTLTDIILTDLMVEASIAQLAALNNNDQIATLTPTRGSRLDALPQATAASRLIYVNAANSPDGKAFMKQTGVQGLAAPVWTTPLAAGSPRTEFIAFKSVAPPSANTAYLLNRGASTAGDRLQIGTAGVGALTVSATAVVAPPNQVVRAGWQIWALRFDGGGQCTAFQNRPVGDIFNISNSTIAYAGMGLGGGSSPGTVESHFRAGLVYGVAMSDDNIRAMLVYLANLYGATLDA